MNAGLFSAVDARSLVGSVGARFRYGVRRRRRQAPGVRARRRHDRRRRRNRGEAWSWKEGSSLLPHVTVLWRGRGEEEERRGRAGSFARQLHCRRLARSSLPSSLLSSPLLCMTTDGRRRLRRRRETIAIDRARCPRPCTLGFVRGKHLSYRPGSAEGTSPLHLFLLLQFQADADDGSGGRE